MASTTDPAQHLLRRVGEAEVDAKPAAAVPGDTNRDQPDPESDEEEMDEEELLHKQERDDVVRAWLGRMSGNGERTAPASSADFAPDSALQQRYDASSHPLPVGMAHPLSQTSTTVLMNPKPASSSGRMVEGDVSSGGGGLGASGGEHRDASGSGHAGGPFSSVGGASYGQDWTMMSRERSRSQTSLRLGAGQGQSQGQTSNVPYAQAASSPQPQPQPQPVYDQVVWEHNFTAMHAENEKLRSRLAEMTKVADQWRAEVAILRTKLGIPIGDAARPLGKTASNSFGNPFNTYSAGTSVGSAQPGMLPRSSSFRRTSLPHFSVGVAQSRSRPSSPSVQPSWASPSVLMESNPSQEGMEGEQSGEDAIGVSQTTRPSHPVRTTSLSPSTPAFPSPAQRYRDLSGREDSSIHAALQHRGVAGGNDVLAASKPSDYLADKSTGGIISTAPTLMLDSTMQSDRNPSGPGAMVTGQPTDSAESMEPWIEGRTRKREASSAMDAETEAQTVGQDEEGDDRAEGTAWQGDSATSPPLVEVSRETSPTHDLPPSSHWQSLIAAHVAHVSETLAPFAALNQDRFERILALGGSPGGRWAGTHPSPGWASGTGLMTLGRDTAAERRLSSSLSERLAGRYNGSVVPGVGWVARSEAISSPSPRSMDSTAADSSVMQSTALSLNVAEFPHHHALSEPPTPRTVPVENRSYDWSIGAAASAAMGVAADEPQGHDTHISQRGHGVGDLESSDGMQTSPLLDHGELPTLPPPAMRGDAS